MDHLGPSEVVKAMIAAGEAKAGPAINDLRLRGCLSGALPGWATSLAFTATAQTNTPLIGALVFPVDLVTIVLLGLGLITGGFALVPLAAVDGRRT